MTRLSFQAARLAAYRPPSRFGFQFVASCYEVCTTYLVLREYQCWRLTPSNFAQSGWVKLTIANVVTWVGMMTSVLPTLTRSSSYFTTSCVVYKAEMALSYVQLG